MRRSFNSGRLIVRPGDRERSSRHVLLAGRIAEVDKEKKDQQGEVTVPFNGILGDDRGRLFDKPLETFDPMKHTDDLPGEDGSEEKISAILSKIEERVLTLKSTGEWDEGDKFSRNPLAYQPVWQTMLMQLKVCKPFDSVDELLLTYLLVLVTTVLLSAYLLVARESFNSFMLWFTGTDVDNDFMNNVMRTISA